MKILIIDNASICRKDARLYTANNNGQFISELKSFGHHIVWYQNVTDHVKNMSDYDLRTHDIEVGYPKQSANKLLRYFRAYMSVIPYIRDADFVYIYYPGSFKFVALLCRLMRKPYGLYVRGMKHFDGFVADRIFRGAAVVLTVADSFTKNVALRSPHAKVGTIRPMIDMTSEDIDYAMRRYCEGKVMNVLFLGRIDRDKGIDELLDAVRILGKTRKDIHCRLCIVGNGPYIDSAKNAAIDLANVEFIGPVLDKSEKKRLYRSADVFVLPTYHEGFPRTLYEAMAYGTPILTTMVGGIPGLMTDKENCMALEVGSADSIVRALINLADDSDKCARMVENGYNTVARVIDNRRPSHAGLLNTMINEIS